MSWNGSDGRAGSTNPPRKDGKAAASTRRPYLRGGIAAIAVVLGAALAWYFLSASRTSQTPRTSRTSPSPSLIKEAKPAVSPTNAPTAKKYSELTDDEKLAFLREKFGDNPPPNIKPIIYTLEHPPKRTFKAKPSKYAAFSHPSERKIAAFLSVKPGSFVMRPQTFDSRFDQDFAASMFDKIVISDDDPPEMKELKQAVIDSKKEIAALVKQGQTPSQVMTDISKQLYDLGQFQLNLRKEVINVNKNPNASDQDVADVVEAANLMLAKKGLPPLKMPNMLARQLNLSRRQEKAAKPADGE